MEPSKLLVVACIPAYNEEPVIGKVISETKKYVDAVLVCDDGSSDLTCEVAKESGAAVIRNEANLGKGASLKKLFSSAKFMGASIVVTIDADGQHDPADIPRLVKPILDGYVDLVVGSRYMDKPSEETPTYRKVGLFIVNSLSAGSVKGVRDTQSGFRAFSQRAIDAMLKSSETGYGIETEQLFLAKKSGLRAAEVPIVVKYDGLVRTSKTNPLLHGVHIVNAIFKQVLIERPLLYMGLPGILLSVGGVLLGLYAFSVYQSTLYFSVPMVLVAFGMTILGVVVTVNAFILDSLNKIRAKKQ